MTQHLSSFATRLRGLISPAGRVPRVPDFAVNFDRLALELFCLQFNANPACRKICEARGATPETVGHWTQIPAVPAAAFKELELTSLPPAERTAIFHSSGTTGQKPSRHFHSAESLAVYEASLWSWFKHPFGETGNLAFLTPNGTAAPHSSLVHMFEIIRQQFGLPPSAFTGAVSAEGSWALDCTATIEKLKWASHSGTPLTLLGTAFSFVHLLDHLAENHLRFQLPTGSRVMETGGYKNRSRMLPKAELHALIADRLGVPREDIICEYGMSELSSQAYDSTIHPPSATLHSRVFRFPPWARAQIISPETGREVADGGTGIIRIFDLANVFSVAAIQTEDLGIRHGDGFKLIGRAQLSEPRGCSLMTA
jgi:hypothetical protein